MPLPFFDASWPAVTKRFIEFAQLWQFFYPNFCVTCHLAFSLNLCYNTYVPTEEQTTQTAKKV